MSSYAESWLKFEESLGGIRPVLKGSAEEMRDQFSGLGSVLASQAPPFPENKLKISDGEVGGVAYRTYKPLGSETKKLPIGVFYHSGGFVVGGLDSEDGFCRYVSLKANVVIVNAGYRLSPEHKAPAHLDDAVTLYEWVFNNSEIIGGSHSNMFTIGTSAGGALALAVARKVVLGQSNLPNDAITGVVALCPVAFHPRNIPSKFQAKHLSYQENKDNVPIVDEESLLQMFGNTDIDPEDKDYFPLLDDTCLKVFPRTYVVTCGMDTLRDDGMVLHDSLSSAGVATKISHYGNMPHCFWIVPSLPETELFLNDLISGVTWTIKSSN
ncbi:sterigmatocystin biosynthesis lipase esterase STCI [Fusarium pseudoanthophilum]|uniref:Sterigmatocystin biosynthesis lipase esterase STCI n=1 Tax=Fusarium pseudoanthophilum TaxID=48495 RepID=A0A8H5KH68_9HYPO|nr:sterigmatocystin biosynthesis lipase esterase STCI [Fusarium pseudoanthophilum]